MDCCLLLVTVVTKGVFIMAAQAIEMYVPMIEIIGIVTVETTLTTKEIKYELGPNHNNINPNPRDSFGCAEEQLNEVVDSKAVLPEIHVNHDEVHGIDIHPIDNYANIFYDEDKNKVDTEFYDITQNDIDIDFVILTPKGSH